MISFDTPSLHPWTWFHKQKDSFYFTIYLVLLSFTIQCLECYKCPISHSTQMWRLITFRVCISHLRLGRTRRRSGPWNKHVSTGYTVHYASLQSHNTPQSVLKAMRTVRTLMLRLMAGSVIRSFSWSPSELVHVNWLPGFALTSQLSTARSPTNARCSSRVQTITGESSTHTHSQIQTPLEPICCGLLCNEVNAKLYGHKSTTKWNNGV